MASNEDQRRWLVCYTAPRSEKKADALLKAKGIESFLPTQKVLKQWSDRKKWVVEPLFRSYLFVYITQSEEGAVLRTSGISRFVYYLGKPAVVPDKQIEDIRLLLRNEVPVESIPSNLKKGDRVRVNSGPLMDLEGQLIDIHGKRKLLIHLKGIDQSLVVELPPSSIDRIPG